MAEQLLLETRLELNILRPATVSEPPQIQLKRISLQLQQQAQPLWFSIDNNKPAATLDLTVGQPLLVEVATGKQINGMTVPRSAPWQRPPMSAFTR